MDLFSIHVGRVGSEHCGKTVQVADQIQYEISGRIRDSFLDRMGFVSIFCIAGMTIIISSRTAKVFTIKVYPSMFKVSKSFAVGALVVVGLLITLYAVFW